MMSETLVLALLQASITGAGLVLAVYTLIIPLSRRFFSYRAEEISEELQKVKERIRYADARVSADELSQLKEMLENIESRQAFPTYLSGGAGITFLGYIASTLMSSLWLADVSKPLAEAWLQFTFFTATILFLLVGLYSIKDISGTMKREFEELKKKVDETKLATSPSVAR